MGDELQNKFKEMFERIGKMGSFKNAKKPGTSTQKPIDPWDSQGLNPGAGAWMIIPDVKPQHQADNNQPKNQKPASKERKKYANEETDPWNRPPIPPGPGPRAPENTNL